MGAGAVGGYLGACLSQRRRGRAPHRPRRAPRGAARARPDDRHAGGRAIDRRRPGDRRSRGDRPGRHRAVPREVVRHGRGRAALAPLIGRGDRRPVAPERHRQRGADRLPSSAASTSSAARRTSCRRSSRPGSSAATARGSCSASSSPGRRASGSTRFVEVANASGGIDARAVADVRLTKWEKYTLLVAFSAVTAATQLTVGDIRALDGRLRDAPLDHDRGLVDRARARRAARRRSRQKAHALVLAQDDDEGTSLRHDLLIGHRMELEALQGTLRRLGRETGIPTPWTDAAYADPRTVGDPQRACIEGPPSRSACGGRLIVGSGPFATEPPRERPDSPPKSYGVPRRGGEFIEWSHVIERLASAEALLDRHGHARRSTARRPGLGDPVRRRSLSRDRLTTHGQEPQPRRESQRGRPPRRHQ